MRRCLIVNADDLGMSRSINDGIARAHEQGIVTSTSLLVTGAAWEGAVAIMRQFPRLQVGLHLSWFVYRGPEFVNPGPEEVTFDPIQVKVWEDTRAAANSPWGPLWVPPELPEDGRWEVQVTFAEPGTYVLRARADDGALYADQDVTVNVTTLLP